MERLKALVSETNQQITIQKGQNLVKTAIGMGCEKKKGVILNYGTI